MSRALLGGLGLLAAAAHGALIASAPWSGHPQLFLALCACAASISGLTALVASRLPSDRRAALWIFVVAVAAHAPWLLRPPPLSEDVYRYAFEGRLVREGVSPYAHAPIDTALGAFRDPAVWPRVGHPDLSSCYPPLSLAAFALGERLGGVRGERLLFGGASLAVVALVLRFLLRTGRPVARAAAFAWAPLPALEFAGAGHHDALGILLLVASLGALTGARLGSSAIAWGLSAAVKGLPAVTVPGFWRRWSWRARATALGLAVLGWAPLLWLSRAPHSGLEAYAWRWRHNDLGYTAVSSLLGDGTAARAVAFSVLVLALAWIAATRLRPARASVVALAAALFLTPTFHPWYAAWPLALAPLAGSAGAWALGQVVLVTYALPGVQSTPGFAPVPLLWRIAEWLPALLLFAGDAWRWKREADRAGPTRQERRIS